MAEGEATGRRRLSAQDWLLAGFRALVRQGPAGLKAEVLARDLGATKGSFYWHFADVPAYRAALLVYWQQRAYSEVVVAVEQHPDPGTRLQALAVMAVGHRDPAYGGAAVEPALRAWAREDAAVAVAVADMDARRVDYVRGLCGALGLDAPELPHLLYAAVTGYAALEPGVVSLAEAEAGMRRLLAMAGA